MRTYTIEQEGKKFITVCRTDGYWSISWMSKNKKLARRKGDEFVSGTRTAMRKYVTPLGQHFNTVKSTEPKTRKHVALAAAVMLGQLRE